jgi:hypothetical protein
MPVLEFLAQVFIGTFGITQPKPEQRKLVTILLGGFILAVSVIAVSVVGFLVYQVRSGR